MITRPMKAETVLTEDLHKVQWPMWCSPKLDGIRLLIHPELGPVTQSFKPLPNHFVREAIQGLAGGSHLDGEVNATDKHGRILTYNETQSALMSRDGEPWWNLTVFDNFWQPEDDFETRSLRARQIVRKMNNEAIEYLVHSRIHSLEQFVDYTEMCMQNGYEGAVLRGPAGPYKSGRSTFNQHWMLKWKPWEDAEGIIVGFEELMHNENEQTTDLLGLSKRSSHKDNLVGSGMLGYFVLATESWGRVRCGGGKGLTHDMRRRIWDDYLRAIADSCVHPLHGRKVTFRYQAFGMKDKPRFPNLKGFRYD